MSIYIIAEAGVNHNGSLEKAKLMVVKAKQANANAIKFQTFNAGNLVQKDARKAAYQQTNTANSETQWQMLKNLELSHEEFKELKLYCKFIGIEFLSTPFDLDSIDFLETLNMPIWKVPSGEITNLPYLLKIAKTGKPIVMSTGMCFLEEIEAAIKVLKDNGTKKITLLHCNTEYPTPYEDVNLQAMLTLKDKFGCEVGYSDHTMGIEVPIAAAALGATVIEKHFTLDKKMDGPDHKASLEPDELATMVRAIRIIEQALGTGIKEPSNSEKKYIAIARKSIVALKSIKKGEIFTLENITTKRPGFGISPMKWVDVLGTTASRDFVEDELIEL